MASSTFRRHEYVLTSKGKLREIEKQLMATLCTTEPSYTEGETVATTGGNKSIQLFGIQISMIHQGCVQER